MTQGKHTQGPWKTDCKDHDGPHQNIKVNSGYRNICTVWIDDAPVRDYNSEQEANARLIAAAPELLKALQEGAQIDNLHRQMHRIEQRRNKGSFGIAVADDEYAIEWQELSNEVEILISKRNAAIDKATGA